MFGTLKRGLTATALAGLVALGGAAAAEAVTITGGGSFSATALSSRLVVNGAVPLNCTVTSGTGSVTNGTFPLGSDVGDVVPAFSSCIGPSNLPFTVRCNSTGTPTPPSTTPANLIVTGNPVGGTTAGNLTGVSCIVFFSSACSANVTGTVPVSYTNPAGGTNGILRVLTAGQSLSVSSTCALIPSGTAQFGGTGSGSLGLTNLDYTLTTAGPTIS